MERGMSEVNFERRSLNVAVENAPAGIVAAPARWNSVTRHARQDMDLVLPARIGLPPRDAVIALRSSSDADRSSSRSPHRASRATVPLPEVPFLSRAVGTSETRYKLIRL